MSPSNHEWRREAYKSLERSRDRRNQPPPSRHHRLIVLLITIALLVAIGVVIALNSVQGIH